MVLKHHQAGLRVGSAWAGGGGGGDGAAAGPWVQPAKPAHSEPGGRQVKGLTDSNTREGWGGKKTKQKKCKKGTSESRHKSAQDRKQELRRGTKGEDMDKNKGKKKGKRGGEGRRGDPNQRKRTTLERAVTADQQTPKGRVLLI